MKILFINQNQFGYHMDTWYYCKYLHSEFKITYICFDQGLEKKHIQGVDVIYIPFDIGPLKRNLRLLSESQRFIDDYELEFVFIKYFRFCSYLAFRNFRKRKIFNLDVRTGSVVSKFWVRYANDLFMRIEAVFFKNISVISESLRAKLRLSTSALILPLGADSLYKGCHPDMSFIRMCYIGTFTDRHLETVVLGIAHYIETTEDHNVSLDLFGSGWRGEELKLKMLVDEVGLNENIKFHGYIHHDRLNSLFGNYNVGVSYVPMTDFFNFQPVTKTFEYIFSGLYVIATRTAENAKVVSGTHGILIDDDVESFSRALKHIRDSEYELNSRDLSYARLEKYHWHSISNILKNYIFKISRSGK
jgi:glycosyltransferase involved in cell wall biosynthesis